MNEWLIHWKNDWLIIDTIRFDYDFERETAVKFNDYFEFPRELDMEPYTGNYDD